MLENAYAMINFFRKLLRLKQQIEEPLYFLVEYRDEHSESYIYFWTRNVSPVFSSIREAENWFNDK